ncbi:hypothetical protein HanIR_Chr10g0486711 [Helianthus annuus]|nr:hypothetical protein HanIR_Chr10g0486711 [Helianthus annuus]
MLNIPVYLLTIPVPSSEHFVIFIAFPLRLKILFIRSTFSCRSYEKYLKQIFRFTW